MGHSATRQRVVLIGASNLTRGISTVVATTQRIFPGPLEIFSALGHGRCLTISGSVLGRRLPGILDCGLWAALDREEAREPVALVTDIGNDLLFGVSVERVVAGVVECLDRLLARRCRVTITALPLGQLERLSPRRFRFFKRLFFPNSRLTWEHAQASSRELDAQIAELAKQRQITHILPENAWYGFDPIHVRRRHWRAAWQSYTGPWRAVDRAPELVRGSLARWLYLRSLAPEVRWLCGIEQRRAQPAGRLADGTTIALY